MQDNRFDLAQLVAYLRSKPDGDLAMYYGLRPDELASSRGIVDVCPTTGRIKRGAIRTDSSFAAVFNLFLNLLSEEKEISFVMHQILHNFLPL